MRVALLLVLLLAIPLSAASPKASVEKDRIVVSGVSSPKGLSVVLAEGTETDIAGRPPVTGEWAADNGNVSFTPKYPLKPGTKYRVVGLSSPLDVRTTDRKLGKPTIITGVYPSGPEIPANVLRFYVHFNRSMPRGDVYQHIRVLNDLGKPVAYPFLEIDDELWNADQTRLTLLIDPGRIKREVKPRIDLGPVFVDGKKFVVTISGEWKDLDGRPLGDDVVRPLTIGPPIGEAVDPRAWKLTAPTTSAAALTVAFDRPMDHALLERSLTVLGPDGSVIAGTPEIPPGERTWSFRPRAGWTAGAYKLHVDPVLEDVCGNAVGRPFEVDLLRPARPAVRPGPVDLPFRVALR